MNAINHIHTSINGQTVIRPLHTFTPTYPTIFEDRITIPGCRSTLFYNIEDIIYLKAESNYCTIYLNDGSKKLFSKTLKFISSFLPPSAFIKVHKSYVVNKLLIKEYIKENGSCTILLENKTRIPVSRSYKKLFSKSSMAIFPSSCNINNKIWAT